MYRGYAMSFFPNNKELGEELFSMYMEKLIEMDLDKLISLCKNKEFKYYSIAMIRHDVYRKNSPFSKRYRREGMVDISEAYDIADDREDITYFCQETTEELLTDIDEYLLELSKINNSYWYDYEIYKLYYREFNSYRKMSAATEIPVSSLYHSVNKSRRRIRKQFGNDYNKLSNKNE